MTSSQASKSPSIGRIFEPTSVASALNFIKLPNTASTEKLLDFAVANGFAEKDHSAIFAALKAKTEVEHDA
jgi:hypothetical protein